MRIAILSDTHDNIWSLDRALALAASADAYIHCGDLCSPFVIVHLGKGTAGKPVHVVWGNNEGDILLITRQAAGFPAIHFHGPLAELELGGCRVGVNHYPEIARRLAESGAYDLVCYGHDHTAHQEIVGETLLLNPGELMGLLGEASFAVYDTVSRTAELVPVDAG